ncbi:hypothetical protein [Arhodomonas sp. AD133]|uniref:hypothetical protein n=1 Tax=Arhodomonas sp. AD133 TaxID=3415009 RepID=UPI003EBB74AC
MLALRVGDTISYSATGAVRSWVNEMSVDIHGGTRLNLFRITGEQLHWLYQLARTMCRIAPLQIAFGVAALSASQVFTLLAFMLPIKILLLVARPGVPAFLAPVVTPANKDAFIAGIAAGAIASYGLFHACRWAASTALAAAAARAQADTRKLHVFADQDELAHRGCHRVAEVLSAVFQVTLFLALGMVLDSTLYLAFTAMAVAEYLLIAGLLAMRGTVSRVLANAFENRFGSACGVLTSINFLVFFTLLLTQLMAVGGLHPLMAVASIVLTRQLLQQMGSLLRGLSYLANNRMRLQALFFASVQYVPEQEGVPDELEPARRNVWLPKAVSNALSQDVPDLHSRWVDSGVPGVVFLDAWTTNKPEYYFVKYYKRHPLRAAHEAYLLATYPEEIPGAPRYLGETFVGNNRLLVFKGGAWRRPGAEQWNALEVEALLDVWAFSPGEELVEAYLRTHQLATDRLGPRAFGQMHAAADSPDEETALASLQERWASVRDVIADLPLVLRNPALTNRANWVLGDHDQPICLTWTNWSIEPLGGEPALLRMHRHMLTETLAAKQRAGAVRADVSIEHMLLVASVMALESAIKGKRLRRALELAAEVVSRHDAVTGEAAQVSERTPSIESATAHQ